MCYLLLIRYHVVNRVDQRGVLWDIKMIRTSADCIMAEQN